MNLRSISKAGTVLVGIAVVAIYGCILYSFYVRRQAEKCLEAVQQFHLGSSTEADARKALGGSGRFEKDGTAVILGKDYPLHTCQLKKNGFHLLTSASTLPLRDQQHRPMAVTDERLDRVGNVDDKRRSEELISFTRGDKKRKPGSLI